MRRTWSSDLGPGEVELAQRLPVAARCQSSTRAATLYFSELLARLTNHVIRNPWARGIGAADTDAVQRAKTAVRQQLLCLEGLLRKDLLDKDGCVFRLSTKPAWTTLVDRLGSFFLQRYKAMNGVDFGSLALLHFQRAAPTPENGCGRFWELLKSIQSHTDMTLPLPSTAK